MTVYELRCILEDAITQLESFKNDDEVKTVSNSYFVHDSLFIGTNEGYVGLRHIEVEEDD